MRLSTEARNAAAKAIVDLIDEDEDPGYIQIRTSTQPSTVADADNGNLLGTLLFSQPAFLAPDTGSVTADEITSDTSADTSGTAGHFRVKDGNDNVVLDGTCGLAAADMIFDNNVIVEGGIISVTSFIITVPVGT